VRLTLQPRQTIFEIAQLQLAEILVNRPRRLETFATRRAIVADPDDVTFLGQQLMPHVSRRAPEVSHLRRVWSTVRHTHHRILLSRIEVGRLDHHRRSEEHTSELQSRRDLVCRLLLEKKKTIIKYNTNM